MAETCAFFVLGAPIFFGLACVFAQFGGWLTGVTVGFALLSIVCVAGLLNLLINLPRERTLLVHGELVMACVTSVDRGGRIPEVHYEYRDFMGVKHQGKVLAPRKEDLTDMQFPVFYDRKNPKRRVEYSATYYRIAGDAPR